MTDSDKFLLLVLSGAIGSGKSTFAKCFAGRNKALVVTTRDLIIKRFPLADRTRAVLQKLGDQLDDETDGKWIADGLEALHEDSKAQPVIVDAIRTHQQLTWLRRVPKAVILHTHLAASDRELESRFWSRKDIIDANIQYEDVRLNPKEVNVFKLASIADICFNTDNRSPTDLVQELENHLLRGSMTVIS